MFQLQINQNSWQVLPSQEQKVPWFYVSFVASNKPSDYFLLRELWVYFKIDELIYWV